MGPQVADQAERRAAASRSFCEPRRSSRQSLATRRPYMRPPGGATNSRVKEHRGRTRLQSDHVEPLVRVTQARSASAEKLVPNVVTSNGAESSRETSSCVTGAPRAHLHAMKQDPAGAQSAGIRVRHRLRTHRRLSTRQVGPVAQAQSAITRSSDRSQEGHSQAYVVCVIIHLMSSRCFAATIPHLHPQDRDRSAPRGRPSRSAPATRLRCRRPPRD